MIKVLTSPPPGKVVVIAPHPDDELLGCGGAMIKHLKQQDSITVLYITDGQTGDPKMIFRGCDYAAMRREEARKGLQALNIVDMVFLGLMDRKIRASADIVSIIFNTLRNLRPDIIYFPSLWEALADHRNTARILRKFYRALGKPAYFMEYEVHSRCRPNLAIDVSDVYEMKFNAISQHKSQLPYHDFGLMIRGLNAFRAASCNIAGGYAEAFYSWPVPGIR